LAARDDDIVWLRARIVRDAEGGAWLEFPDPAACERCARGAGCGAAPFVRLFRAGGIAHLPLAPETTAVPGQRVDVGLDRRWLLLGATSLYLLPLALFLVGTVAFGLAGGGDVAALFGGLAGAVLALLAIRRLPPHWRRPGLRLVTAGAVESDAGCKHLSWESDRYSAPPARPTRISMDPSSENFRG